MRDEIAHIRLDAIEVILRHLVTITCVNAAPRDSEHLKRTLWEKGTKLDLSRVLGPTDVDEIQRQELGIRVHMHSLLSAIEEHEQDIRKQKSLPAVRRVLPETP